MSVEEEVVVSAGCLVLRIAAGEVQARIRVTFWGDVTTDSIEKTYKFRVAALSKTRPNKLTQYQAMLWNKKIGAL